MDLVDLLNSSKHLGILTGAGVSTDSSIPDFRGPNGVWTNSPSSMRNSDFTAFLASEEVRSHHWMNPFYAELETKQPNFVHEAIQTLCPSYLATQNIDGLHTKVGPLSRYAELHGTFRTATCIECDKQYISADVLKSINDGTLPCPPICECGGYIKRDIVMFGQELDWDVFNGFEAFLKEQCDVLLCIGSTLSVFPVAALPGVAKQHGVKVVVINQEETDFDDRADLVIYDDIAKVLGEALTSLGFSVAKTP